MKHYISIIIITSIVIIAGSLGFKQLFSSVEHYVIRENIDGLHHMQENIATQYGAACDLDDKPADSMKIVKGSRYNVELLCQIWGK